MTPGDDNETLQIGPDPDKLFVYHRQQLSAMLDGELSPDQARFMLRRLEHDSELAACWERWQLCGDVLRGQRNELLPRDFAQRVAAAVAGDAATSAEAGPARVSRPRLARWGGGAAIAASVALLAVFVTRQLPDPGALPDDATQAPQVADVSAPAATQPAIAPPPAVEAIADVGSPAGAGTPTPSEAAAAIAATAVAVAEAPRRASERRSPAQQPRRVVQAASEPVAVAANREPPVILLPGDTATISDRFAMPEPTIARPWPRALLPSGSAFTVSSGRLMPRAPDFEPFLPDDRVVPWLRPAVAEPVDNATPGTKP